MPRDGGSGGEARCWPLALTLALYSHAAFFAYATVCLAVEVLFYRDWRGGARSVVALGVAFVAALPLHWELVRYPAWFVTNNLYFEAPPSFDWPGLLRQIWWATEILALPWRWFNDYGGLTHVFLVVLAWMAWRDRTRAGFYAWATLAIVLTLRFNSPQIGLVAGRQLHLLPVLVAPALAGFICRHAPGGQAARLAVAAVVAMFVAVPYTAVPHVPDIRRFNPTLVDRIQRAGGHLVLVENNPHWDMISDRAVRTERSRFDVHFESLLPAATGKLFFGQPQDGYHRSRFRGYSLAGGGFRGLAIDAVPAQHFVAELRRWGVQHLFVWSARSQRYLASRPEFGLRWQERDWQEFELIDADPRSVATSSGQGSLRGLNPVGGEVVLHGVAAGTPVVVRTHFYPAWSASAAGHGVLLQRGNVGVAGAFDARFRLAFGEAVRARHGCRGIVGARRLDRRGLSHGGTGRNGQRGHKRQKTHGNSSYGLGVTVQLKCDKIVPKGLILTQTLTSPASDDLMPARYRGPAPSTGAPEDAFVPATRRWRLPPFAFSVKG